VILWRSLPIEVKGVRSTVSGGAVERLKGMARSQSQLKVMPHSVLT
jgi:hypothetical protein